eukprot:3552169-Rhodomonas_salina.2
MVEARLEGAASTQDSEWSRLGFTGEDLDDMYCLCDRCDVGSDDSDDRGCGDGGDGLMVNWTFQRWKSMVLSRGLVAPAAVDDQEFVFGDRDFTPG